MQTLANQGGLPLILILTDQTQQQMAHCVSVDFFSTVHCPGLSYNKLIKSDFPDLSGFKVNIDISLVFRTSFS